MMHRQLWLIITCTASRVTTAALLSIHTLAVCIASVYFKCFIVSPCSLLYFRVF